MKFNPPFLDSHILHLYDVMNPSTPQEISRSKSIGPTHVTTGQSHSSDQEQRASDGPNDICDACVGLHELQAYCWGTYTDWVQIMRDLWACETLQYNVGKTTVACVTIGRASSFSEGEQLYGYVTVTPRCRSLWTMMRCTHHAVNIHRLPQLLFRNTMIS